MPTLLRIVVSLQGTEAKKRAGKEPSRVKCHTAAHGGGSEEALCGKHVAAVQKRKLIPGRSGGNPSCASLGQAPGQGEKDVQDGEDRRHPSSPEFTPHRAITCLRATGPSIWLSRSVIL